MTEQVAAEAAEEVTVPDLPVMFMGREIWVRMPKPEQLLVWQRTVDRLTQAPVDASWSGSEVMAALERLRKIVDTIMVNRADITWLDDQFLEGTVDFKQLTPFITQAVQAFADAAEAEGNRETRSAAAKKATPAKKAARKKATPAR